ncbi:MAG: zinc ribbon domain-containing protein [Candidatus Puniceispirillaceae bacterium]
MGQALCQSCGMPMKKDPKGGASLADGSLSDIYCSLCMTDGEFHYQGQDVKEYQRLVVNEMTKNGWWRPLAWLATRPIPKLQRWQS